MTVAPMMAELRKSATLATTEFEGAEAERAARLHNGVQADSDSQPSASATPNVYVALYHRSAALPPYHLDPGCMTRSDSTRLRLSLDTALEAGLRPCLKCRERDRQPVERAALRRRTVNRCPRCGARTFWTWSAVSCLACGWDGAVPYPEVAEVSDADDLLSVIQGDQRA